MGSYNTFIGRESGRKNTTGSGNIVIGHGAGPTSNNSNNDLKLYIDVDISTNNGNDTPLIYGEFDNDFVKINGTFEVTGGVNNSSSKTLKERFKKVSPHNKILLF